MTDAVNLRAKKGLMGLGMASAVQANYLFDEAPSGMKVTATGSDTSRTLADWMMTRVLAASAVAVPLTGTGSDSETVLATISIPAGVMGPNGRLRVTTSWSNNNNGNNKTARVRFGGASGTIYFAWASTTNLALRDQREIMNRGAVDSQVGGFPTGGSAFGSAASAPVTSTVDTSAATSIVLSGQLANTGDTITLESYLVELIIP